MDEHVSRIGSGQTKTPGRALTDPPLRPCSRSLHPTPDQLRRFRHHASCWSGVSSGLNRSSPNEDIQLACPSQRLCMPSCRHGNGIKVDPSVLGNALTFKSLYAYSIQQRKRFPSATSKGTLLHTVLQTLEEEVPSGNPSTQTPMAK